MDSKLNLCLPHPIRFPKVLSFIASEFLLANKQRPWVSGSLVCTTHLSPQVLAAFVAVWSLQTDNCNSLTFLGFFSGRVVLVKLIAIDRNRCFQIYWLDYLLDCKLCSHGILCFIYLYHRCLEQWLIFNSCSVNIHLLFVFVAEHWAV